MHTMARGDGLLGSPPFFMSRNAKTITCSRHPANFQLAQLSSEDLISDELKPQKQRAKYLFLRSAE